MKLKIKFLTVVWGETYIKNFCELSLPSWMAEGNIPALAQSGKLEVLVMTQKRDFPAFTKFPAFRRLKKQVPVTLVSIDDLIPGNIYGITLTLAYARPILELKESMLEYNFVFMNADFILADGSLATLARELRKGANVVLAPSLRVTAEKTEPLFRKRVHPKKGFLQITPKDALKMSMPHLHPTSLGKIINFKDYHTVHPNQLFWRVDENTLLGRYFLIFMLAIRPKQVIRSISSWCDYGFVPEFCSGEPLKVLGNSDDFLMIETQEKTKEKNLLRHGRLTPAKVKISLDEWLTPGHLQNFQNEVLFHIHNPLENIAQAREKLSSFVQNINLTKVRMQSHHNHFYWRSGLDCWLRNRRKLGIFKKPNELKRDCETIEKIKNIKDKILFWSEKNSTYSGSPEEPIMEPRLAALEKLLKQKQVFSKSDLIITDHHNVISVLCLLKRICHNKKSQANILVLPDDKKHCLDYLAKIKQPDFPSFITEQLPSAEICKVILKKAHKSKIFLLPNAKLHNAAVQTELVNFRFHGLNQQIQIETFSDKTFWWLCKVQQLLKYVSIDTKTAARLHLKKLLLGYPPPSQKVLKKWKVSTLCEFFEDVNTGACKNKSIWRTIHLKLGLCKTCLTIPCFDELIYIPKIRIPLIYRGYAICNRLIHENNLLEKIRIKNLLSVLAIPHDASLVVISLNPEKSFFD